MAHDIAELLELVRKRYAHDAEIEEEVELVEKIKARMLREQQGKPPDPPAFKP